MTLLLLDINMPILDGYETLKKVLEGLGFKLNPYDECVANAIINGKQCTIAWYVDDLKISHHDKNAVEKVLSQITNNFGEMKVNRGAKHTFVGLNFEIEKAGTVKLEMESYLKECIASFENLEGEITGKRRTPAKHDLFEIYHNSERLDNEKRQCSIISCQSYCMFRNERDWILI